MIFRPPAWRMSEYAIKAARDNNFNVLALSPKEYAKKIYNGIENMRKDVVYYNCNPPFDELKMYEKTEIVYHACEWDKNYLSSDLTAQLKEFIKKNIDNIKFSFLEEML
jgi:predicted deacetylase